MCVCVCVCVCTFTPQNEVSPCVSLLTQQVMSLFKCVNVCACVSGSAICSPSFRAPRVLTKMILNQQGSSLTCDQAIWLQYLTLTTVNVIGLLPPAPSCAALLLNRTLLKIIIYFLVFKESGGERKRHNKCYELHLVLSPKCKMVVFFLFCNKISAWPQSGVWGAIKRHESHLNSHWVQNWVMAAQGRALWSCFFCQVISFHSEVNRARALSYRECLTFIVSIQTQACELPSTSTLTLSRFNWGSQRSFILPAKIFSTS